MPPSLGGRSPASGQAGALPSAPDLSGPHLCPRGPLSLGDPRLLSGHRPTVAHPFHQLLGCSLLYFLSSRSLLSYLELSLSRVVSEKELVLIPSLSHFHLFAFPLLSGRFSCLPTMPVTFFVSPHTFNSQAPLVVLLSYFMAFCSCFEGAKKPCLLLCLSEHSLKVPGRFTPLLALSASSGVLWVCPDFSLSCWGYCYIPNYTINSFLGIQIGSEGLKCCLEVLTHWRC